MLAVWNLPCRLQKENQHAQNGKHASHVNSKMKKRVICSHLSYMEKLTFGRGLEAGSGFGSGDTEEGVPNKEKKQQE